MQQNAHYGPTTSGYGLVPPLVLCGLILSPGILATFARQRKRNFARTICWSAPAYPCRFYKSTTGYTTPTFTTTHSLSQGIDNTITSCFDHKFLTHQIGLKVYNPVYPTDACTAIWSTRAGLLAGSTNKLYLRSRLPLQLSMGYISTASCTPFYPSKLHRNNDTWHCATSTQIWRPSAKI